jgi:hypothetical protein
MSLENPNGIADQNKLLNAAFKQFLINRQSKLPKSQRDANVNETVDRLTKEGKLEEQRKEFAEFLHKTEISLFSKVGLGSLDEIQSMFLTEDQMNLINEVIEQYGDTEVKVDLPNVPDGGIRETTTKKEKIVEERKAAPKKESKRLRKKKAKKAAAEAAAQTEVAVQETAAAPVEAAAQGETTVKETTPETQAAATQTEQQVAEQEQAKKEPKTEPKAKIDPVIQSLLNSTEQSSSQLDDSDLDRFNQCKIN